MAWGNWRGRIRMAVMPSGHKQSLAQLARAVHLQLGMGMCKLRLVTDLLDMKGAKSSVVSKSTRLLILDRERRENSKRLSCTTSTAGASCTPTNSPVKHSQARGQPPWYWTTSNGHAS